MQYWISEDGSDPIGPFDVDVLREHLLVGKFSNRAMVCPVGGSTWSAIGQVIAGVAAPVTAPLPPAPPVTAPRQEFSAGVDPARLLRSEMGTGTVILLSIITLGIFGLVWFYGVLSSYRSLSGSRSATPTLFWVYVGLSIVSVLLYAAWPASLLPDLAALVIGIVLLSAVLADRTILERELGGEIGLHSNATHMTLWIAASVLILTVVGIIVGLPLAIVQAVFFINDHQRLVQVAKSRRPDWVAPGS